MPDWAKYALCIAIGGLIVATKGRILVETAHALQTVIGSFTGGKG